MSSKPPSSSISHFLPYLLFSSTLPSYAPSRQFFCFVYYFLHVLIFKRMNAQLLTNVIHKVSLTNKLCTSFKNSFTFFDKKQGYEAPKSVTSTNNHNPMITILRLLSTLKNDNIDDDGFTEDPYPVMHVKE